MYNSVLAPINFSNKEAESILTESTRLAEKFNAELYILHAFPSDIPEDVRDEEQKLFDSKVDEIVDSVQPTVIDQDTTPLNAIQDAVENEGIELIVMTPTNKTKLRKVIMGSVTEKTIKQVNADVLVLSDSYS